MTKDELFSWCFEEYLRKAGCKCASILPDGSDEVLKRILTAKQYEILENNCFVVSAYSLPALMRKINMADSL